MFGPSVPEHSMILLLALVLSVIAPLVLCAGFVFFCMAIVVETYNWVWVFRRPYEGGGRLWKQVSALRGAPLEAGECADVFWNSRLKTGALGEKERAFFCVAVGFSCCALLRSG
jgi:hypothetical protein